MNTLKGFFNKRGKTYHIINQTEERLAHPYLTIVLGTITIFLMGCIFKLIR